MTKQKIRVWKFCFYGVALVTMCAALIFNFTRSAIISLFLSIFLVSFFTPRHAVKRTLLFISALFLLLFSIAILYKNPFGSDWLHFQDTSAMGRLPRVLLGFKVFIHHPFGIGTGIENYGKYIFPYWFETGNSPGIYLQEFSPHNHFLRAFLNYGFLGGLLLIGYFLFIGRKVLHFFKSSDKLNGFWLGAVIFFFAYIPHILTHNYGPLEGHNQFWLFIGLLVAADRLSTRNENSSGK